MSAKIKHGRCILPRFFIAEEKGQLIAVVGLELYGEAALLRSAAVEESWHYFPRFGFACVDRESVAENVKAAVEFQGACPASAVVTRKRLARP